MGKANGLNFEDGLRPGEIRLGEGWRERVLEEMTETEGIWE